MWRGLVAGAVVISGLACTRARAQIVVPEVEPNNTKLEATFAVLGPGDSIIGTTTGSSTTVPGATSADYFLIKTTPAPSGIYRYELALTSATPTQIMTIRGRNQINGVAGTQDVAVQTSSASTTPPRIVSWDAFGREEQLYVRVTGSGATGAPYTLTLSRTPIVPAAVPGTLLAGQLTIEMIAAANTEFVVLDSNFNVIGGNDDDIPAATSSGQVADYEEGVIYVKFGASNMAVFDVSQPDDQNRNTALTDFDKLVVGAVYLLPNELVKLRLKDAYGPYLSLVYELKTLKVNEDGWVCIPLPRFGACCLPMGGGCIETSMTNCLVLGGVWFDSTPCPMAPCPTPTTGACCIGSTCMVLDQTMCIGAGVRYVGNGTLCNAMGNDTNPCCFADFNQSGFISVQDIFDFLAAFFSGNPAANYNGGPLSVQDLFDFLEGYFTNCL